MLRKIAIQKARPQGMLTDCISISIKVLCRAGPISSGGAFERIRGREELIGRDLEF